MTRYFFIENGKINGCGEVKRLDSAVENVEVSDEIYQDYISFPERYIFMDGEIKQNPEYEKLKQQAAIKDEIELLNIKLDELDKKRVRALCENSIKDEQSAETWIDYYNEEVKNTRNKLRELSALISE